MRLERPHYAKYSLSFTPSYQEFSRTLGTFAAYKLETRPTTITTATAITTNTTFDDLGTVQRRSYPLPPFSPAPLLSTSYTHWRCYKYSYNPTLSLFFFYFFIVWIQEINNNLNNYMMILCFVEKNFTSRMMFEMF